MQEHKDLHNLTNEIQVSFKEANQESLQSQNSTVHHVMIRCIRLKYAIYRRNQYMQTLVVLVHIHM